MSQPLEQIDNVSKQSSKKAVTWGEDVVDTAEISGAGDGIALTELSAADAEVYRFLFYLILAILFICYCIYWIACGIMSTLNEKAHDEATPKTAAPNADDANQADSRENAFALSAGHFLDAYDGLDSIGSIAGWAGGSGNCYEAQNSAFATQLTRAAATNTQVDAVVQHQGEQVKATRQTLDNLLNGLQAAVPVAQALYFSGPAGPALSYNFQLSVATPATSTATDSMNQMETHAAEHAKTLTTLSQEYAEVASAISTAGSAGPLPQQFTAALAVDPDRIKALAPYHQQAVDTFDAAANSVTGAAETISAAHGRVCDASKDALHNVEQAHNALVATMQKYCAGVAAALPDAAATYERTDEWATKSLASQLV